MKVLLVAPNVSQKMGGEAIIPFHYARELSQLGHDVTILTHERVREELNATQPAPNVKIKYVTDTWAEKTTHTIGKMAPPAIAETLFGSIVLFLTMVSLGREAKAMHRIEKFDVLHQPTPVSPQMPSFLKANDAPVIIGPMNGAMTYPPAFEREYSRGANFFVKAARGMSGIANVIGTGKKTAVRLLAANKRTSAGLANIAQAPTQVEILVENGVDLGLWKPSNDERHPTPTFVYVGRHVWWKAVDLLLDAFQKTDGPATLKVFGDGPERASLEERAKNIVSEEKKIEFLGFQPQSEIAVELSRSTALVLPSLRECGGAVVLEAFACGTPAIATDWGGPSDYITPDTGILVPPTTKSEFVDGLAGAMNQLAGNREKTLAMGKAARQLVEENYSWRAKAEKMSAIYKAVG